jgi:hypothetical protein
LGENKESQEKLVFGDDDEDEVPMNKLHIPEVVDAVPVDMPDSPSSPAYRKRRLSTLGHYEAGKEQPIEPVHPIDPVTSGDATPPIRAKAEPDTDDDIGGGITIIHFERSPPDGECYRRAIEVEGQKGVPFEREQRGGQKKEAAGSYRSRSLEGVPAEREQRGGGQKKEAAGSYSRRSLEGGPSRKRAAGGAEEGSGRKL